jgi:hypothetical protein
VRADQFWGVFFIAFDELPTFVLNLRDHRIRTAIINAVVSNQLLAIREGHQLFGLDIPFPLA